MLSNADQMTQAYLIIMASTKHALTTVLLVRCRVYHRLESLTPEDDEAEVSKEFLDILGQQRLAYLQLVHQLIICEETMHAQQGC